MFNLENSKSEQQYINNFKNNIEQNGGKNQPADHTEKRRNKSAKISAISGRKISHADNRSK
ncbi:hypothetical protein [Empedobacter brevis]|uniref:hypothetical protein n=1 Tax=Empedobacter brevis TaxID=247 RepID=UPI0028A10BFF|nr:hypothetical protein [Empedobacter brevis]